MNELMEYLFELQRLEVDEKVKSQSQEAIAGLRAKIPPPVLAHYDRLRNSGKRGVALLRNESCAACHMNVPRGVIINLTRGTDVCLCGSCGRYLYLPKPTEPLVDAPKPVAARKVKAASKKSSRLAVVAAV